MTFQRFTLTTLLCLALLIWLPATFAQSEDLTGVQWRLVSIDGVPAQIATTITLSLDANGQAGGNSGCNFYGGSYTLTDGAFSLSDIASTMMACLDNAIMDQETAYLAALQTATQIEHNGDTLTITYDNGKQLQFVTYDPLLGTQWQLSAIGGTPVIQDTTITLEFRYGQQVVGSGGCNSYSGGYVLLTGTGLNFDPLVSTKMACAGEGITEQESSFLSTLQTTAFYEMQGEQLTLWTAADQSMTFELTGRDPLVGTQWQLLGTAEGSSLTLIFGEGGEVSGSGGCNSFGGSYTVAEGSISFGPLVSTMMACLDDALTEQEQVYFANLQAISSFQIVGDELTITTGDQTLQFSVLANS
ncbi:MAG: META domain-containing protein [Anaerolineae bacterium]|nr:META domain-containing protein [Anaerolineae bacterium]